MNTTNAIKRRSGKRAKKRQFKGNQYTIKNENAKPEPVKSASELKLNIPTETFTPIYNSVFQGNIIIDKGLLFSLLESVACCKTCFGCLTISDKKVMGLSTIISISCKTCGVVSTRNSGMLGPKKNVPDINRRIIYALRCIGQGLEGLKTFCGVMDLYSPVTQNAYDNICRKIRDATCEVATESMRKAAEEEAIANGSRKVTVSGDGTWKTRGFKSQIGVATIIGTETGKVIDVEVMSLSCKGCEQWKGPLSGRIFKEWQKKHSEKCAKNHEGSSGKMEVDGMVRIFKRSTLERNLQYTNYVGDGDARTYPAIQEARPYGDLLITKTECVQHVQKRMGTRLRKLKQDFKNTKLSDGKGISGKGRLTDNLITKLTLYYGNAIRANSESLPDMRNAVWATYFHVRSTDSEPLHSFCPTGLASWCKYQVAVAKGTEGTFLHKTVQPSAIMDVIKPLFNALSKPNLLNRCLGAYTQNTNESLNSLIWSFCPKTSGSGRVIGEIATYEAVIIFNEGRRGRLSVMRKLGVFPGINAINCQRSVDYARVITSVKRKQANTVDARRVKRRALMVKQAKTSKIEGSPYKSGAY